MWSLDPYRYRCHSIRYLTLNSFRCRWHFCVISHLPFLFAFVRVKPGLTWDFIGRYIHSSLVKSKTQLSLPKSSCWFTYGIDFTSADCDGIDEKAYAQLARTKSKYSCVLCRGEKQERMDSFHRKNRNKTAWNTLLYIVISLFIAFLHRYVCIFLLVSLLAWSSTQRATHDTWF